MEGLSIEQRFSWLMGAVCALILLGCNIANATINTTNAKDASLDAPKREMFSAPEEEWEAAREWAEAHPEADLCPIP